MKGCIHEIKQKEEDETRAKRISKSKLWDWFYRLDDKVGQYAEANVKDTKVVRLATFALVFMFLDSLTTQTFLYFNLGQEGNIIPARFFSAGITWEYELMKWLAGGFILAFNYSMATRGWTRTERAGGKLGMLVMFFMFCGVVFWNLINMAINYFFL